MPTTQDFHLPDMSCGHCVATITETLQTLDPAAQLAFNREARRVQVQTLVPREQLAAALAEAGYPEA
ncbi:MAG TPA: heavy-metal-associated domain-containing protein [Burkholderiaceae bacterium]|jgi:copper chaperone